MAAAAPEELVAASVRLLLLGESTFSFSKKGKVKDLTLPHVIVFFLEPVVLVLHPNDDGQTKTKLPFQLGKSWMRG